MTTLREIPQRLIAKNASHSNPRHRNSRERRPDRQGNVSVLAAFLFVTLFGFVAFAVDTGLMVMTQTNLQNAVDAASLAASQEIVSAVYEAGSDQTSLDLDANSIAVDRAREVAAQVAAANGVFVDPAVDVEFGKRAYDANSQTWSIVWGSSPYNLVKVTARRTDPDTTKQNGKLPLNFGWAIGTTSVSLQASSTAFVEARDIVVTLDFSASMNDDSTIASFNKLGQSSVEANLDQIWSQLVTANPKFNGSTKSKFPSTGFGNINSAYGTYVSSTNSDTVFTTLNLGATSGGALLYPFPQAGKNGSGVQNGIPSATTSKTRWKEYIDYVKNHSNSTYRKRYGYRTLIDFLLVNKYKNSDSEDLWRTAHQPFDSMKQAMSLFCDFLDDLDFGDEMGLVVYATTAEIESATSEDGASVNISSNLVTDNYQAVNTIQSQRQAGHYNNTTNIGDGLLKAQDLLASHARAGARRTIVLMTDGLANVRPSGWSLPAGFNWADWTDFDGNGTADYSSSDRNVQYAFYQATLAIQQGITIHTVGVGIDADDDLLEAIARASGGIWIDVPGGTSISDMQEQLRAAFSQIAARVPPPKLVYGN